MASGVGLVLFFFFGLCFVVFGLWGIAEGKAQQPLQQGCPSSNAGRGIGSSTGRRIIEIVAAADHGTSTCA